MSLIEMSAIDLMIREVAMTEIMPRFRNLGPADIVMKGKDDPVTIADKAAEKALTARFTSYLEGSVVVGEEGVSEDKSVLAKLSLDRPIWIIDPIDGTRNFVSGKPEFAVMVGLIVAGKAVAAWIHDPNSLDTIMGEEGGGVWLGNKKVKLSGEPGGKLYGLVGSRVKEIISDAAMSDLKLETPPLEIGSCAGFDYPRLFAGDANFAGAKTSRANFLFYRHTNPWDHVPGLFLHSESGGYSRDWLKETYDFAHPRGGLIIARDEGSWDLVYKAFEPLIARALKRAASV